jgi:hypothetical protein
MGEVFAAWAGVASIFVVILILVVAVLAFLMPLFVFRIRTEMIKLNMFMSGVVEPKMRNLEKNVELTTKLVADMRKRITEK